MKNMLTHDRTYTVENFIKIIELQGGTLTNSQIARKIGLRNGQSVTHIRNNGSKYWLKYLNPEQRKKLGEFNLKHI